jgi:hypothetical protein
MVRSTDNNTRLALPTDSVPLEPALPPEPLVEALETLAGGAVATPCTPPVTAPVSVSTGPEKAWAAERKASKVLPVAGALILPTMPEAQCVGALQWNHMGLVSVTFTVKVDPVVTRPESKPPGVLAEALATKYVHGCENDD